MVKELKERKGEVVMVTFDELMNDVEITDEQIRQDSSVKYFVKQVEDETLKYIDVFNYMKEHVVDMVRDFVSLLREKYPVLIAYLSYVVETCIEDDGTIEEIRWFPNDIPWDCSGEVRSVGYVDSDELPLIVFLSQFTQGHSEATYESGCGLHYPSYDERINDYANEFFYSIINRVVCDYAMKARNGDIDIDGFRDDDLYCTATELLMDSDFTPDFCMFCDLSIWEELDEDEWLKDESDDKESRRGTDEDVELMCLCDDTDECYYRYERERKKFFEECNRRHRAWNKRLLSYATNGFFDSNGIETRFLLMTVSEFASLWRNKSDIVPMNPHFRYFEDFDHYVTETGLNKNVEWIKTFERISKTK